jgi:uncharacterized membrane protein YsdA (DUF1294 family)
MLAAVAGYLVVINAAAFAAFALDKRRAARRERRIPERRLLGLAAAGGSAGAAAAQRLLRHKTVKEPFASRLRLIVALQLLTAGLLAWLLH